jgi:hypothetical protein
MKLDWSDRKYRSIADSPDGKWTFQVYTFGEGQSWEWSRTTREERLFKAEYDLPTREAAKAAAEAWLDEHDKPEWHGPKDG